MDSGSDPLALDRVEAFGAKSLVTLLLAVIGLVVLLALVAILPGVGRFVPGLPITFRAILSALVTLVIVLLLLRAAANAKVVVHQFRINAPAIATRIGAVMYWSIVFFAVVVGYEGFRAAVVPVLTEPGFGWLYDLTFFVLGVIPLILVGYSLFHLLDPFAEFWVAKLQSDSTTKPSTIQTTLSNHTSPDRDDESHEG